jgi:hypothetical protein
MMKTGNLINPVAGINTDKPYSPKQTCGKCHDYDLITQGYHFQQGKDEEAPARMPNDTNGFPIRETMAGTGVPLHLSTDIYPQKKTLLHALWI